MYWDWCLAAKYLGAVGLVIGLGWMWTNQELITEPYTSERVIAPLDLRPLTFSAATVPEDDAEAMVLAAAPDTAKVPVERLAFVDDKSSAVPIRGGAAVLSGVVRGLGEGDVGEVRLTRITANGRSEISVPVGSEGRWKASSIQGGRYRVRAMVPGVRASNGSAVFFLGAKEKRSLDLEVTTPPEGFVLDLVAADNFTIGANGVIALTVGQQVVDADGRSVLSPVSGAIVTSSFSPVVSLRSADIVATDTTGAARFLLACNSPGAGSATFAVNEQSLVLSLPPCVSPPPPEPIAEEPVADGEGSDG